MRNRDRQKPVNEREEREKEYRDRTFRCPFCLAPLGVEENIPTPFGDTVDGGRCACGARFVNDRTGKMLGEAYMEALAFAYDWDYDAALSGAGGGYDEEVVRFDPRLGKFFLGDGGKLDRSPKYYFVRRKAPPKPI